MTSLEIRTAKRGKNERNGVHAWHPYYAGYSEIFVNDILDIYSSPNDIVLDPWNGSGTTTFVAQKKGVCSIGFEINPIMIIHANAKNLRFLEVAEQINHLTLSIVEKARKHFELIDLETKSINDWVTNTFNLSAIFALQKAILLQDFSTIFCKNDSISTIMSQYNFRNLNLRPFFYSALFQLLRHIGDFERGSNPTWLTKTENEVTFEIDDIYANYRGIISRMIQDLSSANSESFDVVDCLSIEGDARDLRLYNGCVDLVITSPPYLTRIDYAFATQPELFLLGLSKNEYDKLRRATTGAPVIVDKTIHPSSIWGRSCLNALYSVANHDSKASRTYYLPIFYQYFKDMEISLREIWRVLKDGGEAILVLQSSYYKNVEFDLSRMIIEMASNLGFDASRLRREVVRQHMAHLNSKSNAYIEKKIYHEDVISLRKRNNNVELPKF